MNNDSALPSSAGVGVAPWGATPRGLGRVDPWPGRRRRATDRLRGDVRVPRGRRVNAYGSSPGLRCMQACDLSRGGRRSGRTRIDRTDHSPEPAVRWAYRGFAPKSRPESTAADADLLSCFAAPCNPCRIVQSTSRRSRYSSLGPVVRAFHTDHGGILANRAPHICPE